MTSLASVLPRAANPIYDRELEERKITKEIVSASVSAPPYGHRKGWFPRSQDDFGDGGAFPECHMAQFPLDMGKPKSSSSNAIAVQLDNKGKIKYDVLAKQGHSKDKIVYSKLTDLLPSAITLENDPDLQKPDEEEILDNTEKTRQALEKLTQSKISAAMPVRCADKKQKAQYIRYTPSQQGLAYNSGAKQRVVQLVTEQVDPMEPPRFKINRKIPRGPPSPPAPVMHSPNRKVTVKEQQEWRIPPCVSNWKNAKGFTIPLDKRLAADGRGLQTTHVNEKFAKLAESLYIADRKAREQIEMRAQLEKKMAHKEKIRKEENLKMLAKKAREDQGGRQAVSSEEAERDKLRHDRARDRKRDNAIANAKGDKSKFAVRERDITEQIALGMPQKTTGEAQFDQRLFNQTGGLSSGFGESDAYNVYDKPWRDSGSLANNIYRPTRGTGADNIDMESLINTDRFVASKGFSGTESSNIPRTGPVQFETASAVDRGEEEDDLFGLIGLLSEAKNAGKRPNEDRDDRSYKRKRDRN